MKGWNIILCLALRGWQLQRRGIRMCPQRNPLRDPIPKLDAASLADRSNNRLRFISPKPHGRRSSAIKRNWDLITCSALPLWIIVIPQSPPSSGHDVPSGEWQALPRCPLSSGILDSGLLFCGLKDGKGHSSYSLWRRCINLNYFGCGMNPPTNCNINWYSLNSPNIIYLVQI